MVAQEISNMRQDKVDMSNIRKGSCLRGLARVHVDHESVASNLFLATQVGKPVDCCFINRAETLILNDKLNLGVAELRSEEFSDCAVLAVILCEHSAGVASSQQAAYWARHLEGKSRRSPENLILLDWLILGGAGLVWLGFLGRAGLLQLGLLEVGHGRRSLVGA